VPMVLAAAVLWHRLRCGVYSVGDLILNNTNIVGNTALGGNGTGGNGYGGNGSNGYGGRNGETAIADGTVMHAIPTGVAIGVGGAGGAGGAGGNGGIGYGGQSIGGNAVGGGAYSEGNTIVESSKLTGNTARGGDALAARASWLRWQWWQWWKWWKWPGPGIRTTEFSRLLHGRGRWRQRWEWRLRWQRRPGHRRLWHGRPGFGFRPVLPEHPNIER